MAGDADGPAGGLRAGWGGPQGAAAGSREGSFRWTSPGTIPGGDDDAGVGSRSMRCAGPRRAGRCLGGLPGLPGGRPGLPADPERPPGAAPPLRRSLRAPSRRLRRVSRDLRELGRTARGPGAGARRPREVSPTPGGVARTCPSACPEPPGHCPGPRAPPGPPGHLPGRSGRLPGPRSGCAVREWRGGSPVVWAIPARWRRGGEQAPDPPVMRPVQSVSGMEGAPVPVTATPRRRLGAEVSDRCAAVGLHA